MNSLLNIFLCFAIFTIAECLPPVAKEKVMAIHKECAVQSGVSDETILKALEGVVPEDAAFKGHLFCVFKLGGFQNDAGELQPDVIKEKLKIGIPDETKYNKILSECLNQKSTPEETAIELGKCMAAIKNA